jgi:GT2 family glycosyltransferase
MRASVIIVNWNAGVMLAECLGALAPVLQKGDVECIVVDNGSSDGSDKRIEGCDPLVRLVRTGGNLGFAVACNIGARCARGRYLLFLNPDARVTGDALEKTLDYLDAPANQRIGILGVQLRDGAGSVARSCARFPGARSMTLHALGIDRVVPSVGYVMVDWDHGNTRIVDHVIGAYYLVRREVFDAVQGFDERFFLYLEDLDFSLRAKRAGWDSVYLTEVAAYHAGGGTSAQVKARRLFYALRSRVLYASFHFGAAGLTAVGLATLVVEPGVRIVRALASGSLTAACESISAYWMLYRWMIRWCRYGDTRWNP